MMDHAKKRPHGATRGVEIRRYTDMQAVVRNTVEDEMLHRA
jgi:hypothetical protein